MSSIQAAENVETAVQTESNSYPITPEGKRTVTVLLVGVVAIALFAIWSIVTLFNDGLSGPEWITAALMLALFLLSPLVGWNLLEERASVISTDSKGLTFRSLGGITLQYDWNQVRGLRSAADRKSRWASFLFDDEETPGTPTTDMTPASGVTEATSDAVTTNNTSRKGPANNSEEMVAQAATTNGAKRSAPGEDEDEAAPGDDADRETLEIVVDEPGLERIANGLVRLLHEQSHRRFIPVYPGVERREQLLSEIARRSASRS